MIGIIKTAVAWAGAVILVFGAQPAAAGCQLIVATDSAPSKSWAAAAAHQNAIDTARQVAQQRGWRHVSLRARKVKPDPFWKAVRPVVTADMLLKPDIVTAETYTQCWRGLWFRSFAPRVRSPAETRQAL